MIFSQFINYFNETPVRKHLLSLIRLKNSSISKFQVLAGIKSNKFDEELLMLFISDLLGLRSLASVEFKYLYSLINSKNHFSNCKMGYKILGKKTYS